MKLIKSSFQIIEPTGYTIDDIYKSIELAGRVSHKSEDKITETSAKDFVGRMLNMKHLATCEFGTVYLCANNMKNSAIDFYWQNPYSKEIWDNSMRYITTNYRVLIENNKLDCLKYLCEPTEYHHKRYTVKFICDRGILAEFTRHRAFSFMAESSRYNNYSKNKFNNELTFIQPNWAENTINLTTQRVYDYLYNETYSDETISPQDRFLMGLKVAEDIYLKLINSGWKAEQARNVLPLSLKTELYMCGFAEDWEKFFELRCASNSHPQARELAIPLREEFIKRGYMNG